MPGAISQLAFSFTLMAMAAVCLPSSAQSPDAADLGKTTLPSGIVRISGTEPSSHIQYVRMVWAGKLLSPADPAPDPAPSIIAQCTVRPNGKAFFDLFANFGAFTDLAFYPPWKPKGPRDFAPATEKATITMEFLGYTRVKPVKKQWEIPVETPGQYRYNQPGLGSPNMEDLSYYLQYLIALPTLRLTFGRQSAEFNMAPVLEQIRKEPGCVAARLR